jgi:hypothetical protein
MCSDVIRKESKRELLFYGGLLGLTSNVLFSIPIILQVNVFFGIFLGLSVTFVLVSTISVLRSEKGLKVRQIRLFFFGLSLVSFAFSLIDLGQFAFGFHWIQLSNNYPYLWLGNVPFVSFLASFSTGGFFGVMERFLELHEKKDL